MDHGGWKQPMCNSLLFCACKGILIEIIILSCPLFFVHQVVEVFSNGNLEEFPVPSFFHAWLYASQLSSALEYLEAKNILHSSVIGPFVYISSPEKVDKGHNKQHMGYKTFDILWLVSFAWDWLFIIFITCLQVKLGGFMCCYYKGKTDRGSV